MKFESSRAGSFSWVDNRKTVADVSAETQQQFVPLRDEQLKALMLQVDKLSREAGVELDPAFKQALKQRAEILADHAQRKAQAEPD